MPHGIPLGIMCTDEVIAWQNNYHCQVNNTRLRVEKDWLPGQFHIVNCGACDLDISYMLRVRKAQYASLG